MPAFPPGVHLKGGQTSAPINAAKAREFYAPIIPVVVELRRKGLSLRAIARELDRLGIRTRIQYPDQRWNASQIRRILARAAQADQPPCVPDEKASETGDNADE
jgi:hypothetical protein